MDNFKFILVTGGAGFIGSSLIDRLLTLYPNTTIVNVDNFNNFYDPAIKEKNIAKHKQFSNYHIHRINIENIKDLSSVFEIYKFDLVIHLAARAGVRPSIERPFLYSKTNVLGTINILECMMKYCVPRLIFASSSSVYGNSKAKTFKENQKTNRPISPYAASKIAAEQIIYTYSKLYNIKCVILRLFTVYGPRQRPDLAINKFIRLIDSAQPIEIYGNGDSKRDYTYISDIVDGFISAMNYRKTSYEIFNLGGGSPVSLKKMIHVIEQVLNKKAKTIHLPMQKGDVDRTSADISKAKNLLNYNPSVDIYQGIVNFFLWQK